MLSFLIGCNAMPIIFLSQYTPFVRTVCSALKSGTCLLRALEFPSLMLTCFFGGEVMSSEGAFSASAISRHTNI